VFPFEVTVKIPTHIVKRHGRHSTEEPFSCPTSIRVTREETELVDNAIAITGNTISRTGFYREAGRLIAEQIVKYYEEHRRADGDD
jgi:uncharacterized protein (DUF1778 family)